MTQEYLFVGNEHKAEIQQYKPDSKKVNVETVTFKNTDCWVISYTVDGENEDSANILSGINTYITKNFSPIVLTNDSSAYYNKRLFPYINEFERKLRKLLYLKSAVNKDDAASENIKNLEEQDLGKIFELLFTDDSFMTAVRDMIRAMTGKFTKDQITAKIESIDENANWDHLIGKNAVPTLKGRQLEVRSYRNDVMHAHNINAEIFHKARKLFKDINEQLDSEIGTIMKLAEKQGKRPKNSDYNKALKEAIQLSDTYAKMADLVRQSTSPELFALQDAARKVTLNPDYVRLQEILKEAEASYPKAAIQYPSIIELQKVLQRNQAILDLYRIKRSQAKDET